MPSVRASRYSRRVLDDARVVEALRAGDEAAFVALVDSYAPAMERAARALVRDGAVAEEVMQETWIAFLNGLHRFEQRSSLKTWLFRILTNVARNRARKERRSVPFSAAGGDTVVDPDRFLPGDHDAWPCHWAIGPTAWETPEERLLAGETRELILEAVELLPETQRAVITLRDIDGWSAPETCNALELTETNQRVLLHRARSAVRTALESHLAAMEPTV